MPRATQHNSRGRKDGSAFSSKHNDREFDLKNAEHIDAELTPENVLYNIYDGEYSQSEKENKMSFTEVERRFYEEHFSAHLNAQNESYEKQAHTEKIKSIDEYYAAKRTRPESQIVQIGNKEGSISADVLHEIVKEQLVWEKETYPQAVVLDYALHVDEPNCAPHIQISRVWIAHDKNGMECVGQSAALREMGIALPHEDKKENKYNNAKITYTLHCREHLEQLCRDRGIELDDRKPSSEVGLNFLDYKCRQAEAKAKAAEEKAQVAEEKVEAAEKKITELTEKNNELENKLEHALDIINNNKPAVLPETKKTVRGIVHSIDDLNKRVAEIEVKEKELEKREKTIKKTEGKLKELINRFDPEKFRDKVLSVLQPIINIFAGSYYEKFKDFLKIRRQEKLVEEFERGLVKEAMKNAKYDPQKEIQQIEKEFDTTMKEYRENSLDLDER